MSKSAILNFATLPGLKIKNNENFFSLAGRRTENQDLRKLDRDQEEVIGSSLWKRLPTERCELFFFAAALLLSR